MVEPGDRVLVAVSGGPDSIGLLLILSALQQTFAIELLAAHVNHQLRGDEADGDETCAATVAKQLGVPFVRRQLSTALARGGNLEARARELRYGALHELAGQHGCRKIATGHTRDDQAETVLLRLVRGAGPTGLSGIQPRRRDGVIRPLIDCTRRQIERVVRLNHLPYRIDSSNADPRFQRTHIRRTVLPVLAELNPAVTRAVANLATLMRAQQEIVADWTEVQATRVAPKGKLTLAVLRTISSTLQGHIVRAWLLQQGAEERGLTARHVNAVLRLGIGQRVSGRVALPGGREVRRRAGYLVFGAEWRVVTYAPRPLSPSCDVHLPGGWHLVARPLECQGGTTPLPEDLWQAVCDTEGVAGTLTVRAPVPGERLRPIGLGGRRKLSDIFIDRKIPADERAVYPVIVSGDAVVWVPGVVRSEALRVTPRTRVGFWLDARRED